MSRHFSPAIKRAAWERCDHRCEYMRDGIRCNVAMTAGNRIYDHRIPWAICQDSSLGNCQVICVPCDRERKTPQDLHNIAHGRRVADFHLGIKGPGLGRRPMAGGRRSRVTKTFRRGVQTRLTGPQRYKALMKKRYGEGR